MRNGVLVHYTRPEGDGLPAANATFTLTRPTLIGVLLTGQDIGAAVQSGAISIEGDVESFGSRATNWFAATGQIALQFSSRIRTSISRTTPARASRPRRLSPLRPRVTSTATRRSTFARGGLVDGNGDVTGSRAPIITNELE